MSTAESQTTPRTRVSDRQVVRTHRRLRETFRDLALVDALPTLTLILNGARQAVYASPSLLAMVGASGPVEVLGRRPGEILGCTRTVEGSDGCGSSMFCRFCGAAVAIVSAGSGGSSVEECRLLRQVDGREEAVDLRVTSSPLELDGEPLVLLSIADVSDEKRRQALERVFHHDLLNTAGALRSLASILGRDDVEDEERGEIRRMLADGIERLIGEVEAQRMLSRAEAGGLSAEAEDVDVAELIRARVRVHSVRAVAEGRGVRLRFEGAGTPLRTDPILLGRVVDNLLRNAIEASAPEDVVRVGLRRIDGEVEIEVTNPSVMSPEVQAGIFRRSFSTKEPGRGIGTWSVKLLTEGALRGHVGFASAPGSGTTFRIRLRPLS